MNEISKVVQKSNLFTYSTVFWCGLATLCVMNKFYFFLLVGNCLPLEILDPLTRLPAYYNLLND